MPHWDVSPAQGPLFDADDEALLAAEIAGIEFSTFVMRGVAARRCRRF